MIICFSLSTETSFNSACARRRCSVVDVLFRSLFAIYCDEFEIPSSPLADNFEPRICGNFKTSRGRSDI